jgi:glutamine amidotransferase
VRRLSCEGLPIPHMGWNQLELATSSPLFEDIQSGDYVYFVHSYCAPVSDATLAKCTYGETFSAVVQRGHVYGTQFHPERSGRIGSLILRNFLRIA